ncbi:hypothetical protein [Roseobacter ponti]|uniref:Uncharacterized protein n=1 Tax=Roseobacter ponti TaxID=1891787 RepID=A0A858SV14_9RHOB|nr:hypothetical protein [Roseobacter ponti]QJF51828.1 hypothetical protein G3256_11975 [Roseobacter ponti]
MSQPEQPAPLTPGSDDKPPEVAKPAMAASGLRWTGNRFGELLSAAGAALAAFAGFIWALSPWLVFAAILAGFAALVSTDARGWLTTQAKRASTLIAGAETGPPGFLYLEAPQVYTRERLVNDRFTQANWLRGQLERTGREGFIDSFSKPSAASDEIRRLAVTLRAAGLAAPKAAESEGEARAGTPAPEDVLLDRLELFEKVNTYRSALRGELMDVQLDDGHDLDGNTLYRLNFNAVVAPFHDRRSYPGSAVFLIRAKPPDPKVDEAQLDKDLRELLLQWQREMQAFLTRVLDQRLEDFERQSALENPTDPKEDLALDWFMRTRLVETFLTYLNDFSEVLEPYLQPLCGTPGEDAESEEVRRKCRIDKLAELAGFGYRTDEPAPDMTPAHAAGFRRAIELAHLVNVAQWPKAGAGSYDQRCAADLWDKTFRNREDDQSSGSGDSSRDGDMAQQRGDGSADRNAQVREKTADAATRSGPDGGTDPVTHADKLGATVTMTGSVPVDDGTSRATDSVSDKPADGSPDVALAVVAKSAGSKAAPGVTQAGAPSGAAPDGQPSFGLLVEQQCLVRYEDPYRLRALMRLLSITDDLGSHSLTMKAQRDAVASAPDDIQKSASDEIRHVVAGSADTGAVEVEGARVENKLTDPAFSDEGAGQERHAPMTEGEARLAITRLLGRFGEVLPETDVPDGTAEDADRAFTIAGLEAEMVTLKQRSNSQLAELQRRCATEPAAGAEIVDEAIRFARCRFLYAPSANVRGLLAEFIVARIRGDLKRFYRETPPALNQFLDVTTDGCVLTSCRIRVDLRRNEDGEIDEASLARDLTKALDKRTNGLSIYEIAPRAGTVIRRAGGGGDLAVGLDAPQASASAETSRRDQTAFAEAVVLGFGQAPAPPGAGLEDAEAVFGWTVRPQPRPGGGWAASHHRLSAVISVPSWWKRLDLELHACWIGPDAARKHGDTLFATPSDICASIYDETQRRALTGADAKDTTRLQAGAEAGSGAGAASETPPRTEARNAGHFRRPVRVQLPRSVDEVTARFNFDLVKTPYFDSAWRRDNEGASNALMAGRPAHIALAGERLWRGTVVTIDGQPADRITVLPDMKGVIAEFRCVRPTPHVSPTDTRGPRAKLVVWTAEGRTKPMDIDVRPFEAVKMTEEKPCYLERSGVAVADGSSD